MSEPKYIAETLAWCNERRAEKKKPPLKKLPKGVRQMGDSCPCGKATGLHVGARFYGDDIGHLDNPLPRPVILFVKDFDAGFYPQYEVRS